MTREPPVRPSRTRRAASRARRRRLVGGAIVAAVVVGVTAWALLPSHDVEPVDRSGGSPTPGGASPVQGALALSVRGAAVPLLAVVDGGAPPAMLSVPPQLSLEIPGVGSGTTQDLAAEPGPDLRTGLSNTVGLWLDHYAVMDLAGLAAAAERAGGLALTLPAPVTLNSGPLPAGPVTLSGAQLVDYLGIDGPNAYTRFEVVLSGLADHPLRFEDADVVETDDLGATNGVLRAARGAQIATFPTTFVTGHTRVPDYGALDALMAARFGAPSVPVPVLVQNGVGTPGLAAQVARLIVPKGFRIVLSQNAADFDHEVTQVVATGKDHEAEAERARRALGVGVLAVTQVPSGLADVTIVIGKDFTA